MKLKFLLICLAASTLFNGCKKDSTTTTTPSTSSGKTDLLCGKNWMLTGYTVNPGISYFGTILTNLMGTLQPCQTNNILSFNTNNTYKIDEGATKCSGSAPQTFESGTWAFNTGETHLLMTNSATSVVTDYTFVTLNSTTAQVTNTTTVGGTTYVYTSTFTKQ